ncbi:MAG: histidine phosphatase family protein [Nannocystaceae bacterium]
MSTLVLIRHGQASLAAADYDVLSPIGVQQAAALGRHLAARREGFDHLITGPLRRQVDTMAHLRSAAADAGHPLPEAIVDEALAEYPALEILARFTADAAARDPEIAALQRAFAAVQGDRRAYARAFDRLFQAMMRRWLAGDFDGQGIEGYDEFQARIDGSLARILERAGRGARIAVVTSAGPIGAAMRRALNLAPWDGLRASFVVANTGLTELWTRPEELTLTSFNGLPHLDSSLVTYR